jgi:hypothetical protein
MRLALLALLAIANAQLVPHAPVASGCTDLSVLLGSRVAALDDACCANGGECPPSLPDVPCCVALVPLLTECGQVLDALLDGSDGNEDGMAAVLRGLERQCRARPPSDIIQSLKLESAAGLCPDEWEAGGKFPAGVGPARGAPSGGDGGGHRRRYLQQQQYQAVSHVCDPETFEA